MQLTNYTDYSFRTLIALGAVAPDKITVAEISSAYDISLNHLLKVVQRLSALGYVETLRGKTGGVRLACNPAALRLGDVVRNVEPEIGLVGCLRAADAPCVIAPACRLKGILAGATDRFLQDLDQYTLADLLTPRPRLQRLLKLGNAPA
jgi:Rrf2 family transcriptional regulator, nitric oxide-sensitive transcriptional repressor